MKRIVEVLLKAGKLKSVKRTGWVREGMPDPESVAAHTWRMCFLILLVEDKFEVSTEKLIKMAIVHDIAEALTGDEVVERGVLNVGQHDHISEEESVKDIFSGALNEKYLLGLWKDHLSEGDPHGSKEAQLLYQFGKIATVWQALEYEIQGEDTKKLDEFWENARKHVKEPLLVEILDDLESWRKKVGKKIKSN